MHIALVTQVCIMLSQLCKEEFEDDKWVIRNCKLKKDRQHNGQKKKNKGQAMIRKALHTES